MKQGSIVKVAFPQADGKIKPRPAIILKEVAPYGDWLICAISSKSHLEIKKLDIVIDFQHPDFKTWGLNYPGIIRVAYLSTIPENIIEGTIGKVSEQTVKTILNNLLDYFSK
jgi:mRNA interferase MazF